MFRAILRDGNYCVADEPDLKHESNDKGFYRCFCECDLPVFLKRGMVKRPHFALYESSLVHEIHQWETESEVHLELKFAPKAFPLYKGRGTNLGLRDSVLLVER